MAHAHIPPLVQLKDGQERNDHLLGAGIPLNQGRKPHLLLLRQTGENRLHIALHRDGFCRDVLALKKDDLALGQQGSGLACQILKLHTGQVVRHKPRELVGGTRHTCMHTRLGTLFGGERRAGIFKRLVLDKLIDEHVTGLRGGKLGEVLVHILLALGQQTLRLDL